MAKCHSTIGQAVQAGKDANAKFLLLTHFSQRYPKVPPFGEDSRHTAFAFDYMSFRYEDMEEVCGICAKVFQMLVDLEAKDDSSE
jgi:ribonuclease Z